MDLALEKTIIQTLPMRQLFDADNFLITPRAWASALWAKPMINRRTAPGWQGCQSTTTARKNTAGSRPFMAGQRNEFSLVDRLISSMKHTTSLLLMSSMKRTTQVMI